MGGPQMDQRIGKFIMSLLGRIVGIVLVCAAVPAAAAPGDPVRVAVIDGGVARTAVLRDLVETELDMAGTRAPFSAKTSHGTAVATVIAQHAHAPIRIVSLRVDLDDRCGNDHCEFDIRAVRAAVLKAVEMKVDVINMSLDTPFDTQLYVMLRHAADTGVRVVMAAGNEKREPRGLRYAQMLGDGFALVGAKDRQGRPADFSARPKGDCGCRFEWRDGVDVATQDRRGQPATMDGTSFAAPLLTAEIVDGGRRAQIASR